VCERCLLVSALTVLLRGRKEEKRWARAEADPIKLLEAAVLASGRLSEEQLEAARSSASAAVRAAVDFAVASPPPPRPRTIA